MKMRRAHYERLCWSMGAHIPHGLWIADREGKAIDYINPAWERLSGSSLRIGDDLQRLYETVHSDDLGGVLAKLAQAKDAGADVEYRIVVPSGAVRWMHLRTFAIPDGNHRRGRIAGIIEDITERVAESLRVERLKDEFVSTVSHELRTPMTSIAASLGLLLGGAAGDLPEPVTRLLAIALANSQRLVRLINDLLEIEALKSEKAVLAMQAVDVRASVEQSVEANRGFAESVGARIRVADPTFTGAIRADPDRVAQVLTNLLSNALKFSPGGEVAVHMAAGPDFVRIAVRDQGPGVPESFKARIFERFAQAEAAAPQASGTGLGLSIVKQIMTRLGGSVGFDNAPGGGAVFYVDFPNWRDDAPDDDNTEKRRLLRAIADLTVDTADAGKAGQDASRAVPG